MSLNGIDISSHQTGIDLAKVPCDFVICKATEGVGYVNPDCGRAYAQGQKLGKKLGVYHFATGKSSGAKEAGFFLQNIRGYVGEALLALDWEGTAVEKGVGYALEFLETVFGETGVRPLIYMNSHTAKSYDWKPVTEKNYGLWLAQYKSMEKVYGYADAMQPEEGSQGNFPLVALYQYTSQGRLPGYEGDLDLNVAYMDGEVWERYAAKGQPGGKEPEPEAGAESGKDQPVQYRYQVGQHVVFSTCYVSSTAPISQAIPADRMAKNHGVITRIYPGTPNPYLLDQGLCFVNDGDIRGFYQEKEYYTIQPGDTLSGIAEKFHTTVGKLQEWNAIPNADRIYAGKTIRVR